jgi:hypothetical protein
MPVTPERDVIEIDIRTRTISPSDTIHILFPGEGYANFDHMKSRSVVYLDTPGLKLDGRVHDFANIDQLKERMALSTALRTWHRAGRFKADEPTRQIDDYTKSRFTENRALLAGAIERLYFQVKPSALIVVPGPGLNGDVLIGEIYGKRTSAKTENYGADEVPARTVKWLSVRPKSSFSAGLIDRLSLPNYFIQLDRSFHEEIYRASFENYVFNGRFVSKLSTTSSKFTTIDDYQIQSFVNLVAGALAASSLLDHPVTKADQIDVDEAVALLLSNQEWIPDLTSNINSPGAFRFIHNTVAPLVLAALMALASSGDAATGAEFRFVNSSSKSDTSCVVQVDASVRDTLTMIGIEEWQKKCDNFKKAAERTGLKPSATVKKLPRSPQMRGKRA